MTAYLQICGGLIGLILLYYGAEFLVKGGVNIATRPRAHRNWWSVWIPH